MNAKINENQCTGCGICANICPEGIEMVNRIAKIKDKDASCLSDAAKSCPKGAIILDGDSETQEDTNNSSNQNFSQGRGMGQGMGRGLGGGPRDGRGMGRGGGGRGQGRRF